MQTDRGDDYAEDDERFARSGARYVNFSSEGDDDAVLLQAVEASPSSTGGKTPWGKLFSTLTLAGAVASLVFHVWLIATLSSIDFAEPLPALLPPLETRFSKVEPVEEPDMAVSYELANPDDKEQEVRKVVNARSTGLALSQTVVMQSAPSPQLDFELRPEPMAAHYDIPEGMELDDRVVIKGTTGEAAIQIESALDRVTWEIANTLHEHKVLVVWLIDASASLKEQRAAIGKRLHRIYGELGALEKNGQLTRTEQGLLSGVVTFGEKTSFITQDPTAEFTAVYDAVTKVQPDPSGTENVFGAVDQVVHRWSKYRTSNGRSIMIITVTDETGDDYANLETALTTCKRYGAKCYVIGPAAVFGRREGFVPYVAKENGKTYQLPVDLGPDTFGLEAVSLPFWFEGPQYEYLSAGIGPYALTRMVKETGGVYFMTNMTTTQGLAPLGTYSGDQMKGFEPDYRFGTPDAYMADLSRHPLRAAVAAAAQLSLKHKARETPRLEFRVTPQNYMQTLSDAQKSAAETTYVLDTMMQPFQAKLEQEYQRESSPRWRVSYDLALGRMLALKVRAFEYNSACAQLKTQLGSGDVATKSNHWIFRPDTTYNGGAISKKMAAEAEKRLKRVLTEAPGTPWAVLASRELSQPFGFRIIQRYVAPPAPPSVAKNNAPARKAVQLANDNVKKKPAPPPKPPPPPPVLPKL